MTIPADRKISNFPFLTRDEFEDVCKACLPLFQKRSGRDTSTSAKLVNDAEEADHMCEEKTCYLSILTHKDLHGVTKLGFDSSGEHDIERSSVSEDDLDEVMTAYEAVNVSNFLYQEALKDKVPPVSLNRFRIEYEILLSPSYRVPVLYFRIYDGRTQLITDVDVVYNCLVPSVYCEQLHDVGIIGGISMAVSCSR